MYTHFIIVCMTILGKSSCKRSSIYKNECGVGNPNGIGFRFITEPNNDADFGEFPWTAAIMAIRKQNNETFIRYQCAGVIIAPNIVLTTANCVVVDGEFFVRGGEWHLNNEFEQLAYQDRQIKNFIIHDKYRFSLYFNDIAILVLKIPFEFNDHIQPICLPAKGTIFQYSNCFVSGWGIIDRQLQIGGIMQEAHFNVVPQNACEEPCKKIRLNICIHEGQLCAQNESNYVCTGSTGAPMACPIPFEQNRYYLAGIVSASIGCGTKDVHTIFTNIAHYRDWIDRVLTPYDVDSKSYSYEN